MILCKIPQHGVDFAADPGDIVTAHVSSDQHPIIIDRIVFIFQSLFVPDTGIKDYLLPILDIIINGSVIIHRS